MGKNLHDRLIWRHLFYEEITCRETCAYLQHMVALVVLFPCNLVLSFMILNALVISSSDFY